MDVEREMPVITELSPVSRASDALEREDLFPIREVSRLTGVNPVTLRAWERRYGLIEPTRTESGHRLYSMTEIERVRSIVEWIDRGVSVSKVGKILAKTEPLKALSHIISDDQVQADYQQWQHQVKRAVSAFDDLELDRVYGQIFSSYSLPVVFRTSCCRCGGNCCWGRKPSDTPANGCFSMATSEPAYCNESSRYAPRSHARFSSAHWPVSAVNWNCWWLRYF